MASESNIYKTYDTVLYNLDGDLDDVSIQKLQNTGNYLNEKSDYDNNLFEPAVYNIALSEKNNEYKTSKEDEKLYGFIPGDWLPNWVKAGYNQSLTGFTEKIVTGDDTFDLSGYDPNILEDIGSFLVTFFQPADFAVTLATGGVGAVIGKEATKASIRKAIQLGVGRGVSVSDDLVRSVLGEKITLSTGKLARSGKAKGGSPLRITTTPLEEAKKRLTLNGLSRQKADEIIEKAAPKVLNRAFNSAVIGGTQLGAYSGLQSSLGQIANPEQEFDFVMNIKNASKGAVLGAVTGGTGPIVKNALKGLSPVTQTLTAKAVEATEFGILAPSMEGELPTLEDFAHAAGVIGALGAQRYAAGKLVSGYKKITQAKKDMALTANEGASILGRIETQTKIEPNEIFTDKTGVKIRDVKFDVRTSTKEKTTTGVGTETTKLKEDIVNFRDVKTGEANTIKFSTFLNRGFTRGGAGTKNELIKRRVSGILNIKNNLKMSTADFRRVAGSELVSNKGKQFSNMSPDKIIKSMTPLEQLKMLNQMRHQARVNKMYKRIKDNGWETTMLPYKLFSDYHQIKFLDRSGKRLQTQLSKFVEKKVDNFDARYANLMAVVDQMLVDTGLNSRGFAKGKESVSKKSRDLAKERAIDIGRKLQDPNSVKEVQRYRDILEYMWEVAQKAGVDLGPKEELYFPHIIKQGVLKKLATDIGNIRHKNPQLFSENVNLNDPKLQRHFGRDIVSKGSLSSETLNILYEMAGIKNQIKEGRTRNEIPDFDLKMANAFKRINTAINAQFFNVAKNLEIARKAKDLPSSMLETDARIVFAKYTHQWARRVAEVEQFGRNGEFWKTSVNALRKLSNDTINHNSKQRDIFKKEADVLENLYKIQSGKIELDPLYNWKSPQARKAWSDIVDFQIGTKIGLGFATIPNLTQLMISTAVKTGYYPLVKAAIKLADPTKSGKEYRKRVRESGSTALSLYQSYFGLNPSDSFMGKFADGATRLSGFQKINQLNQLLSAAAAREWVQLLQPIAQGKGTGKLRLRREWAKKNLRDLGISNENKITERQMSESMYKFARDSQLQRNILQEPLIFNDPRFRPLFLFKKFGYKQFNWIRGQLSSELKRGNVFPMLRLASAGLLGGEFVSFARDKLSEVLAGKEVYDENEYFLNFGNLKDVALGDKPIDSLIKFEKMTFGDVLDRFATVGAFGVVMDIVAAENTIRALEFAGKPAIVQDFSKIWLTMTKTWENIGDYGGIGALRRMPKYISPALGTVPRRLLQGLETEEQTKSYIRYRKGQITGKILDYIIEGNSVMPARLIKNWNRTFPQNPILYDDVSVDAIRERIINKIKKRANP
tara:strand:+ start:5604 stop:9620 length:4017 start_codon:yes stop_codon:yes gene_type:complete